MKKSPKTNSPHSDDAHQYALDVVAGKIPACKWVKLACQRHLDDLGRGGKDWLYEYDAAKANRVCAFIERLPHIKGKWAGTPIKLEGWQKFILCCTFGWLEKKTKIRRFRTIYTEVPRKNAKSTLTSGVGLYMLTEDGEQGAEVYSAATTRDQAKIVFNSAQQMARKEPEFREHYGVAVGAHNINVLATGSKFEALSSEDETLDGLNVHCGIVDELHAHKTRGVWDVLETATGSREQPLLWAITTAGSNRAGICYEQRDYVAKILEKVCADETYFGIIFTQDEGDSWESEDTWRKANPNYGVSVNPEDLARKALKAMQMPSAVNNFLTKHLNVWVNAETALFDLAAWDACGDKNLKPEDFTDCPCWIAMDLASVNDIASVVKLFRKSEFVDGQEKITWAFFGRHYLPEESAMESRNSQYSGWLRTGRLIATDGNVTDLGAILDDVVDDIARFDVQQFTFDVYNKLMLFNFLKEKGIDPEKCVETPQTVAHMSPATEALMKAILARQVAHDGDPVMAWALSNVVGHFDAKDNVYPKKERAENKIDPALAMIMGMARASFYESSMGCPLLVI